ncbi:MAG: ABC transporter ATP-binding protein [bacterium]|nr:ABC transporter ATP-binding protein [bacterium]
MRNVLIKTDKLCKSYVTGKQGVHVLKNLDLEIYEGDFTVIMGSSGSGKSTLLYSISTMDRPTSGSVKLLGREVATATENEVAEIRKNEVSFIFQSMNLLPDLSAFENIAYAGYGTKERTKEEVNRQAAALLQKFHIEDLKDKFPSEMSGGQKQRVAVARALITGAKVVFGDEPTGALNSMAGKEVLDLLTEINKEGQSIVMVTHDLKAARRATRLLYLTDGQIDGELRLGRYIEEEKKKRDEVIDQFLKERGW